jgi:hypothetical protein
MKEIDAVKNERFVALRYAELTPGPANIEAIAILPRRCIRKHFKRLSPLVGER